MTFYLKYRPQKIAELDLEEVRATLSRIVSSGKIPHALLFWGPKGSGKTSAARILAKVLNCQTNKKFAEPCNKCSACKEVTTGSSLDVVEIDAASYRGIDDVRVIREAVRLSPAKSRFRIYIIDEAHMLTTEAFNALLKTLEEPPPHGVFILATTALSKVPETIKSRCVLVRFAKAKESEIIHSLRRVVEGEKLKVGSNMLSEIAKVSDGSFRDGAKILEQAVLSGKITPEAIREVVGTSSELQIREFLGLLASKESKKVLEWLQKMAEAGSDFKALNASILEILHAYLLKHFGIEEEGVDVSGFDKFNVSDLKTLVSLFSEASSQLKFSPIPELPLELAVIEWCEKENQKSKIKNQKGEEEAEVADEPSSRVFEAGSSGLESPPKAGRKSREPVPSGVEGAELRDKRGGNEAFVKEITDEVWTQILRVVKPRNHSVEALLRATRPTDFDGRTLTLEVFYKFHKERLEQESYRKIVEEVSSEILGRSIRIVCLLSEKPSIARASEGKPQKEEVPNVEPTIDEDIIKAAKEIFGGKLVD